MNGLGGAGGLMGGSFPANSGAAMPGQKATALGSRSQNPWNFQNLMENPAIRFGLNLMAEGGPQRRSHDVGQDISRAVGRTSQMSEEDEIRAYRQQQMQQMQQMQQQAVQQLQGLGQDFNDPNTGFYNGGMQGGPQAMTPPRTLRRPHGPV